MYWLLFQCQVFVLFPPHNVLFENITYMYNTFCLLHPHHFSQPCQPLSSLGSLSYIRVLLFCFKGPLSFTRDAYTAMAMDFSGGSW